MEAQQKVIAGIIFIILSVAGSTVILKETSETPDYDVCRDGSYGTWENLTEVLFVSDFAPKLGQYYCAEENKTLWCRDATKTRCYFLDIVLTDQFDEGVEYSKSSKKKCVDGKCQLQIYSGINYVQEDGLWKPVEKVKSLKGKISLSVYVDSRYPDLIIEDYNLTSITVCPDVKDKDLGKEIQLRSIDKNNKSKIFEDKKLKLDKVSKTDCQVLPFGFDKEIHWGENSTTIKISNGLENVRADDTDGGTFGYRSMIKYDISTISQDVDITNSLQCSYIFSVSGSMDNDIIVWRANNQTWIDSTLTTTGFDNIERTNQTIETLSSTTDDTYTCFNVTTQLLTEHNLNNDNLSLMIQDPDISRDNVSESIFVDWSFGEPSNRFIFETIDDGHATSNLPYLNITYTIPTYNLSILDPTTSSQLNTNASTNITITFNYTKDGTSLTSNINILNITIGEDECSILADETCDGTPTVCSIFDNQSACEYVNCSWSTSSVDYTTQDCDAFWGFDCDNAPNADSDNTHDTCSNYAGSDGDTNVVDVRINGTVFEINETIEINCTFKPFSIGDEEYIYVNYPDNSWSQEYSASAPGSSLHTVSISFTSTNQSGKYWARCIIDSDGEADECADGGGFFDNDDLSFNITDTSGGCSGTPYTCDNYSTNTTCTNNTGCSWDLLDQTWYTAGTGWKTNCTTPSGCTGTNDLFLEANYATDAQVENDTQINAVICGVGALSDLNLSFGPPGTSLFRFSLCGPDFENATALPETQNSTYGIDYICNNGTAEGTVCVKLSGVLNTGWTWYAANNSAFTNQLTLTTSCQDLFNLTTDSCAYVWHKANCSYVTQRPGAYEIYEIN